MPDKTIYDDVYKEYLRVRKRITEIKAQIDELRKALVELEDCRDTLYIMLNEHGEVKNECYIPHKKS